MKQNKIFAFLLLALLASCRPGEQKEPAENKAIPVQTWPVHFVEYQIPVRATGLLATAREMKLSFKTGGIVRRLKTQEGSRVKKGEILAELDLAEIRAQASQARISLEKAERDLGRIQNLYRDSVATLEQYQNARSALELARAQKQIADFNLKHSRIQAPSDGKIQKVLVETNELIGPGHPALLFASTESDWILRVSLTDKDIVSLSIGDTARIFMDAFPEISFRAELSELGGIADPVTGTYEAELLILNALEGFRTGFISRAEIYPSEVQRSLVVPVEALINAKDRRADVFVQNGTRADKRSVRTGFLLDSLVVVQEGLKEGEMIITAGAKFLRDGNEILIRNIPSISGS